MATPFSELMNRMERRGDSFALHVPAGWMQGRTLYGGLSAALCLEAARRAAPDAPPLRSAQISFVGPAGGEVLLKTDILRQGRSVVFVGADLIGEKGLATRAVFCFGAARASALDAAWLDAPACPAPQDCPPYFEDFLEGVPPPAFTQHYDVRLAKGARPASASSDNEHFLWVRHKDDKAAGAAALLALADMPPPAVMPMFKAFAPVSSMTWIVNLLTADPDAGGGWRLVRSCAENAAHGYSSQHMTVWSADGEPLVSAMQNVAIFV